MRQVWIREEAYDIARRIAFETRKSIGQVISNAIENNVKVK